jgi:hypothetical protein
VTEKDISGLVILIWWPCGPLWLLIPAHVSASLKRRSENRPGASSAFAYSVRYGWRTLTALLFIYALSTFNPESNSSSESDIYLALVALLAIICIHVSLFVSSRPQDNVGARKA